MQFLKERIGKELGLPCFDPANGSTCYINTPHPVPVKISSSLFNNRSRVRDEDGAGAFGAGYTAHPSMHTKRQLAPSSSSTLRGVLIMQDPQKVNIFDDEGASHVLKMPTCQVVFPLYEPVTTSTLHRLKKKLGPKPDSNDTHIHFVPQARNCPFQPLKSSTRIPKRQVTMRHSVPIRGADGPEGPTALAAALDLVRSTLEQV